MPSQTRRCQNVVTVNGVWTDPNNIIKGNEGVCATTSDDAAFLELNFLDAGTPFTIPAGASITGIGVVVKGGGDGGDWIDLYVRDDTLAMLGPIRNGNAAAANCGVTAEQAEAGGDGERWGGV